jgi:hypothetical protein
MRVRAFWSLSDSGLDSLLQDLARLLGSKHLGHGSFSEQQNAAL